MDSNLPQFRPCPECGDQAPDDELQRFGICGVCEAIKQMQATIRRKHKAYFSTKTVRPTHNDP